METFKSGEAVGNAAAINVQLGWIPDRVEVIDVTNSDKITIGFPRRFIIPFTSGGVNEIVAGNTITGVTSGATAVVKTVLLHTGNWAAGSAEGFFVIDADTIVGTFESENVIGPASGATNDATVTVHVTHSVDIDTEVAAATGDAALAPYNGTSAANSKGFIIGSSVAVEAALLRWSAWRQDR